ncbi:DUF5082 family protein [Alkalihalophilus pseudofirmus]|nr:DUF5082 family protein [Alkalihalophilus pseudofirmus]
MSFMPLTGLYLSLRQKQDELARLRSCRTELMNCREDFYSNEHLCKSPSLSSVTWAGSLADRFENLREGGLVSSYRELPGSQLDTSLQTLSSKISQTEQEIISLQQSIVAAKAAMVAR